MSQSTRSGSKLAQKTTNDQREVTDALLDRSDSSTAWIFDQLNAAEERTERP